MEYVSWCCITSLVLQVLIIILVSVVVHKINKIYKGLKLEPYSAYAPMSLSALQSGGATFRSRAQTTSASSGPQGDLSEFFVAGQGEKPVFWVTGDVAATRALEQSAVSENMSGDKRLVSQAQVKLDQFEKGGVYHGY